MWCVLISPSNGRLGRIIPCVSEQAATETVWRLREELQRHVFVKELPSWLVEMLPVNSEAYLREYQLIADQN
jgi:hypothetical protein